MITTIQIAGVHYELDDAMKRYIHKKIGRLDKYIPRHARKSVSVDVRLKRVDANHGNKYEAEVTLLLPKGQVIAKESTLNMFAAVDIVETKLKNQLRKYKEIHKAHAGRHGLLSMIKRGMRRRTEVASE